MWVHGVSMSAKANPETVSELETESNGRDVQTLEAITHDYDYAGHTVLAECTACSTASSRRLLTRDYDTECDFKQSLAEGDDDYVPCVIYRYCEECGREESHFVC